MSRELDGLGGGGGINTIIFDLDNTLLHTTELDQAACTQVSKWLAEQGVSGEQSQQITQNFLRKYREAPAPPHSTDQVGLNVWRRNIWAAVLPSEFLHLLDDVFSVWKRERLSNLSLDPSVTDMLGELASNFNLGLITNGQSVAQWEKINESGCEKYFDTIVVSGDTGVEKPSKDIYDVACDELQVAAAECVMVGDKLETDIKGGVNAGVGATVWINRKKKSITGEVQPDFTIPCVTHLTDVLEKLQDDPKI